MVLKNNQSNFKDHESFVLLTPPAEIVGVDPQERVLDDEVGYQGVFIPGRTVKLSPYYIGRYQLTYKLWQEVYNWAISHGYTFENSGCKGSHGDDRNTENDPVAGVSWYDCIVWCNAYTQKVSGSSIQCVYRKISGEVITNAKDLKPAAVVFDQSKKGYRLPTEAEWEFAARYQGSDSTNALRYGDIYLTHLDSLSGAREKAENNEVDNSEENGRVAWYYNCQQTHPVGQKAANHAGLYDMSGNVWEWCYDGWEDCIPIGTQTNPIGIASSEERVSRGGGWFNARCCVVGWRNSGYADLTCDDWWLEDEYSDLGFRIAYSL